MHCLLQNIKFWFVAPDMRPAYKFTAWRHNTTGYVQPHIPTLPNIDGEAVGHFRGLTRQGSPPSAADVSSLTLVYGRQTKTSDGDIV